MTGVHFARRWSWLAWLSLAPLGALSCGDDGGSSAPEGGRDAGGEAGSGNEPSGGGTEEGGSGGASGSGEAGASAQGGSATGGATDGGEAALGGESGAAPTGGTGSGEDETSPTILTSVPAHGDVGVRSDVNVVVTFSEPMDRIATQMAYVSTDLRAGNLTFEWNEEGTELTIVPDEELEYAEGDLEVDATSYELAFEAGATDLAGNPLVPETIRFRTLRRITQTLPGIPELDGNGSNTVTNTDSEIITVGDLEDDTGQRGFFSIDLSSLPEEVTPEDVEVARLRVYQAGLVLSPGVSPYCPGMQCLGAVVLDHVEYGPELAADDYATTVLQALGTFSETAIAEWKEADVLSAVRDDVERRDERESRSQYRLRFTTDSNGNGTFELAQFRSSDSEEDDRPQLEITALVP